VSPSSKTCVHCMLRVIYRICAKVCTGPQGRREKLVSGGGAGQNISRPFFSTQTNLHNFPSEKNFYDLFFFFTNFPHFCTSHRPPPQKPSKHLCHGPPHTWAPHPTFRGALAPSSPPPVYAPAGPSVLSRPVRGTFPSSTSESPQ
jgi:hypothetical protein